MQSGRQIPWAKPHYWGREREYVLEALDSSWISGGPFVDRFEQDFAGYIGSPHAIAVANGTAALHLAYLTLDLKPGDEIIVPGFGYLAAANVALQMGIRPRFAEVDPDTWCMRAADVEPLLTNRTRAVVAIHTYGNVCPLDELIQLARSGNVDVIEDAAEALGSRITGAMAGALGTIGTYSFHATKTITTGEGGMLVCRDPALADRMKLFLSHGVRRGRNYWHEVPGHNFRLTNLQAALGCAQLEQIETITMHRHRIYESYKARLIELPGVRLQRFTAEAEPLVWAVAVRLDPDIYHQGRDAVIADLAAEGIELRPGFYPPSEMSFYECPPLPSCETISREIIVLPSFPTLEENQIQMICECLARAARGSA